MAETPNESVDPALRPPTVITEPGEDYAVAARTFQGIPSMERSPGGRLWVTWYAGPGGEEDSTTYVAVAVSDDGGATWREPFLAIDPGMAGPVRAYDPNIWLDPRGRLWVFWAQTLDYYDGRAGVWAIVTENPDAPRPTWSEPRRLAHGIMMNKPTALSTGEWILPAANWRFLDQHVRAHKAYPDIEGGSHIYVSKDEGRTWRHRGAALVPETQADEHMVVELTDGRLWMLVRTDYGIGQAFSDDRGRTWVEQGPSGIAHPTSRFFIRRLRSGNLLLVKHHEIDRTGNRSRLMAFVSEDEGESWRGGLMLDERNVAYPDGTQAEDGTIYITYDRSRRGAGEILCAQFTEADAAAGKIVSPGVKLRQVVSAFGPDPNREGVAFREGEPTASFDVEANDIARFEAGATLFSDRDDTIHKAFTRIGSPAKLEGMRFLRASMDERRDVVCTEPGMAYVVTPLEGGGGDSLAGELREQGFEKTDIRRFMLFIGDDPAGNIAAVYQKHLEQGERLRLGRWCVLVF